jgi:lysozyme family protein
LLLFLNDFEKEVLIVAAKKNFRQGKVTLKDNFLHCLQMTLIWEGGYTDNPSDPGGKTNWGITWKEYNRYRRSKGLKIRTVRFLTRDEMHEIYKTNYWDSMKCDDLPIGVDHAVFDLAVNNGVGRARQFLAIAKKRGVLAPQDLIDSICDQRLIFDRHLKRLWKVFGNGWYRRIQGVRKEAKGLVTV